MNDAKFIDKSNGIYNTLSQLTQMQNYVRMERDYTHATVNAKYKFYSNI